MDLILHIKICADAFNFSAPVNIKGVQYIDIDNFSDAAMVETVNRAIDLSDRLFVFIQIEGSYDLGLLMKVMQKLMKYKGNCTFLHASRHDQLDKMLVLIRSREVSTDNFLESVARFFT